jgi:hypothetical protein
MLHRGVVAQIKAINARGLLDDLAQEAKAGAVDLIEVIRAAKKNVQGPSYRQGRIYVSSTGSGQSHSFLIPQTYTADFTPVQIAAQYQEFVEIYNDNVGWGLITDATNVDADLAVMLADDRLQTVNARRLDITGIRFPGYAPA